MSHLPHGARKGARLAFAPLAALLLAGPLGGCAQLMSQAQNMDLDEVGGALKTGIKTVKDLNEELTPENEYYVGRSVAATILARHDYLYADRRLDKAGKPLPPNGALTEYLNEVGAVVSAAAMESRRKGDRPAPLAGWRVVALESPQVNAFAAPGGFLFVTTGALLAVRSEDELACLLAHEVAHVVRGHGLQSVKRARFAGVSADLLKASGSLAGEELAQLTKLFEGAIDDIADSLITKGYSRESEYEADEVGAAIAARAGYDAQAMLSLLDTLEASEGGKSGGFGSTHPAAKDRATRLRPRYASFAGKTPASVRQARFESAMRSLR